MLGKALADMRYGGRIPDDVLADSLGRLAVALDAGIDARRSWAGEARRVPARWQPAFQAVADGVASGGTAAESMARTHGGFPDVVTAAVAAGESTGRETEALRALAASLKAAVRTRRGLVRALVGPAVQLGVAILVVGLLIAVGGGAGPDGRPLDMLGLGLFGSRGLAIYAVLVAAAGAGGCAVFRAVRTSARDGGPLRRVALRLPVLGPALVAGEAAAWCRAAALADHAGLAPRKLVGLAAAAAPGLAIDPDAMESRLRQGATLAGALAATGRLPRRVTEMLAVGEASGQTAETLERLAADLDEECRGGLAAAAQIAAFAVWAGVACVVALVVVRFFGFYSGVISAAGAGR